MLGQAINSQEYEITDKSAFHPQIKSKVSRFNKNKSRKYTIKDFTFKTWHIGPAQQREGEICDLVNIYFLPSKLYGPSKSRFLVKNQL